MVKFKAFSWQALTDEQQAKVETAALEWYNLERGTSFPTTKAEAEKPMSQGGGGLMVSNIVDRYRARLDVNLPFALQEAEKLGSDILDLNKVRDNNKVGKADRSRVPNQDE